MNMTRTVRALARLVSVIAIVAATVGVAASPAAAGPDTCMGLGTLRTQSRLYYPTHGPSATGSFSAQFAFGGCVIDPASHGNSVVGVFGPNIVGNYCGWATGQGAFAHHGFGFTWAGNTITLEGGVLGTLYLMADSLAGQS